MLDVHLGALYILALDIKLIRHRGNISLVSL